MAPTTNNNTTTVRAHEHDTLDALCHRHLGRTAGTVEATLAATPGLARSSAALAAGQHITLVVAPAPAATTIQLWE